MSHVLRGHCRMSFCSEPMFPTCSALKSQLSFLNWHPEREAESAESPGKARNKRAARVARNKEPHFSPARVCQVFAAAVLQTEGGQGHSLQAQSCPVLVFPGDNPDPSTEPFVGIATLPFSCALSPRLAALRMLFGAGLTFPFQCQQDLSRALPKFRGRGAFFESWVCFAALLAQLPQGFQALCCRGNPAQTTDSALHPKLSNPWGSLKIISKTAQAEPISTQNVELSGGNGPKGRGRGVVGGTQWTMSSHVCLGQGYSPAWQKGREKRREKLFWQCHSMTSALMSA